ncbi:MAG: class I SAM-dependent methyltransferase [Zavarzinella sp.]
MATPDWQLPDGIDRGLWDYLHSLTIAQEYDQYIATSPVIARDVAFCEQWFAEPAPLVDLGCGTGRLALHFADKQFPCTAVDLSQPMLDEVSHKATESHTHLTCVQANLVDLSVLQNHTFRYAACLFSTLGMICGAENRLQALKEFRRIVQPGGTLVLHVHNANYRFGMGLGRKGKEAGDRTMKQLRAGIELTIHHYTWGEIVRQLHAAGWSVVGSEPISTANDGVLNRPHWLPRYRAHGYLLAAQ